MKLEGRKFDNQLWILVQKLEGIQWTIRQVEMDLSSPHEDPAH